MAAASVRRTRQTHTPERFGDYLVLGKIASGGMAEVHLASAMAGPLAGKPVALKRMLPPLSAQQRFVDMFLSEAAIASRLEHDNVCRIYDYGAVDGTYFIAMEYLHGNSLGALLTRLSKRGRRLKLRFAAAIFDDVCAGLQAAHDVGVIHRDISPNNIFITTDGAVKLIDFGVAKASFVSTNTRTGVVKGTFAYMSPEHLEGGALDCRTDLFSLGVVMHEALTCRRLFKRNNDYETCRAITRDPIPRACDLRTSVPVALSDAIDRALARQRQDRYASATELRAALRAALVEIDGPPSREAIGADMARVFADELERIDDLVAEQPTHVALSARRRPAHAVAAIEPHRAGDIIAALPLRSQSAHDADAIHEQHPTGSVPKLDDGEPAQVVRLPTDRAPTALDDEPPAASLRPTRRRWLPGLAALALALGLLVLGRGGSQTDARGLPAADVAEPARVVDEPAGEPVVEVAAGQPTPAPAEAALDVDGSDRDDHAADARTQARSDQRSKRVRQRARAKRRARSVSGPGARIAAEL